MKLTVMLAPLRAVNVTTLKLMSMAETLKVMGPA